MKGSVRAGFWIAAALALVGCGGGSSNSTGAFVGTWAYSSGQLLVTYAGDTPMPSAVTGNLTLGRGATSDLLYSANANGSSCNFMFDARGTVASIRPGSSCIGTFTDPNTGYPFTFTLTPSIWTLQLNGTILNENGSGTCTAIELGQTSTCTFTQTATLSKIGL